MPRCACGCGAEVEKRFARGHWMRVPANAAKMQAARGPHPRGAAHPHSKFDRNQKIALLDARGWTHASIARRFGISRQRVEQIVRPRRHAARSAVGVALASGKLVRPDICEACGGGGPIESHHHDYDRPLDILWLCRSCHTDQHRGEGRPRLPRRRIEVTCPECGTTRRRRPSSRHRQYCSQACARAAVADSQRIDSRALLDDLRRLAEKFGRTPTSPEIIEHGRYSHVTYYRHFGSLPNAHRLAGLEVYETGGAGHRRTA